MNTYKIIGDDGREYDPVDLATIRAWVVEGRLDAGTQVLVVGVTAWKSAWTLPELELRERARPPPRSAPALDSFGSMPTRSAGKPTLGRSNRWARRSTVWTGLMLLALVTAVAVRVGAIRQSRAKSRENEAGKFQELLKTPARPEPEQPSRKQAERGYAETQYRLGMSYLSRTGKTNEYGEAAKWFRRAADRGHTQAQYALGHLYGKGVGVARDYAEAAKWFRLAAEQGYALAQHSLGHLYADGRALDTEYLEAPEQPPKGQEKATPGQQGIGGDYVEAAQWWRKAADQGDAQAQFDLG